MRKSLLLLACLSLGVIFAGCKKESKPDAAKARLGALTEDAKAAANDGAKAADKTVKDVSKKIGE